LKRTHITAQKRKPLVIQWNFDFFFFVAIEKKGGRGPHTQIRLLQIDTFFSVSCQWQLEKLGKKEWEKCHSSGFVVPHSDAFSTFSWWNVCGGCCHRWCSHNESIKRSVPLYFVLCYVTHYPFQSYCYGFGNASSW